MLRKIVVINAVAGGIVLAFFPRIRLTKSPAIRFLGHILPLFVFYLFYRECGIVLDLPSVRFHDATLQIAESSLKEIFPDPSRGAGEQLAFAYMSYVPFLFTTAVLAMRRRGGDEAIETLVRRIAFVWAACFVLFLLIPVLGPRFMHPEEQASLFGTGRFSAIALLNQRYAMLHGGSFPSAHIAAVTVAISSLGWRQRMVLLPFAAAIVVSVIALRYHYRLDVVAGVGLGLAAVIIDRSLTTWLAQRCLRSATAVPAAFSRAS